MRAKPTMMPSKPRPKATPHSTFSRRSEGSEFWGTGENRELVSPEIWLGMTWLSTTGQTPKLRRLRPVQSRNGLNKGQVEKEALPWVCPSSAPQRNQASRDKGLTPKSDCCEAIDLMSHDAREKIRGCWREV